MPSVVVSSAAPENEKASDKYYNHKINELK